MASILFVVVLLRQLLYLGDDLEVSLFTECLKVVAVESGSLLAFLDVGSLLLEDVLHFLCYCKQLFS